MRLREPVRDPELAADRLRALEAIAPLLEAAEARVEVRASEQRVRLDRGKAALLRPGELLVEEREHLADGSPTEEHCAADFVPRFDLATEVAGCERVLAAFLERHELRPPVAREELGEADDLPGIGEVSVAAERLEHGDRPTRKVAERIGIRRGTHDGQTGSLHLGALLGHLVTVVPRSVDRLEEGCVRGLERSRAAERNAELAEQRCACGGLHRNEPARSLEEGRSRCELASIERTSSRASEQATSSRSGGDRLGARSTELRTGEVRLLEVVTGDLLLPGQVRTGLRLQPGSEPLVEVGTELLRHGRVRDVADQDVVEAKAVVGARSVRVEQLLAREREEGAAERIRVGRRE